jgi:hypothetical protein
MSKEDKKEVAESILSAFNKLVTNENAESDNQLSQAGSIVTRLQTIGVSLNNELTKSINAQNKKLKLGQIDRSDTVKAYYTQIEIDKIRYQNNLLGFLYYCFVLILAGVLFLDNKTMDIKQKFIIIILLLFYPTIIYHIQLYLYIPFAYVYSYMNNIPYEKVYISSF